MTVLKSVLREELNNSKRMEKEYKKAVRSLPKGTLVSRIVKGHRYYYLAVREGKKIRHIYKGKISAEVKNSYEKAKKMRAKYRKLLSKVKKQIAFLEKSLRGKEEV
jgi:hypothetical protein